MSEETIDEMFDFSSRICHSALSADREFSKPLLKVGEKSILDWLVDDLVETTDIDEFVVISNHKFAQHFEDWKNNKKKFVLMRSR